MYSFEKNAAFYQDINAARRNGQQQKCQPVTFGHFTFRLTFW